MNRLSYLNLIEERLGVLANRIESRGKLNLLDLHLHSENFFRDLLNLTFDWRLENANSVQTNTPSIDLVDEHNKIVVQVSAVNTKEKVVNSLSKNDSEKYKGYTFKFVSISKSADILRKATYSVPVDIVFDPNKDIIDTASILKKIFNLPILQLERIHEFITKELGTKFDKAKLESNLTDIITFLSKEDLNTPGEVNVQKVPEIQRKMTFNNLVYIQEWIVEYAAYAGLLDKIYNEYDKMGKNKSISILSFLNEEYVSAKREFAADDIFFRIKEKVIERVEESQNFVKMPKEELELCVKILLVDAFIRCKIYQNPENYNNATS